MEENNNQSNTKYKPNVIFKGYKLRLYPNKEQIKEIEDLLEKEDKNKFKKEYEIDKVHLEKIPTASSKIELESNTNNLNDANDTKNIIADTIKIPSVNGNIMIKPHINLPSNYTICKTVVINKLKSYPPKYWISFTLRYEIDEEPLNKIIKEHINFLQGNYKNLGTGCFKIIGLDYSEKSFYIDSNGKESEYLDFKKELDKNRKDEKKLQNILEKSETEKGETKKEKTKKEKNLEIKLKRKIKDRFRDLALKESNYLLTNYDIIAIETLDFSNKKNKKENKDKKDNKEEKNKETWEFKQWKKFITILKKKARERNKLVIEVEENFPSTQLCNNCHYKNRLLKEDVTIRKWTCPSCNTHNDRDKNAAINIRNEGVRYLFQKIIELNKGEKDKKCQKQNKNNSNNATENKTT